MSDTRKETSTVAFIQSVRFEVESRLIMSCYSIQTSRLVEFTGFEKVQRVPFVSETQVGAFFHPSCAYDIITAAFPTFKDKRIQRQSEFRLQKYRFLKRFRKYFAGSKERSKPTGSHGGTMLYATSTGGQEFTLIRDWLK